MLLGAVLVLAVAASASAASMSFAGAAPSAPATNAVDLASGVRLTLDIPLGAFGPGQTVRSRQVVVNSAQQELRYALTSASGDDDRQGLRDILEVTIRTADSESGPAATCDRFDGPTLYHGPLAAGSAGFGDAQMGGQPGDRLLASSASETLCIQVTMPLHAGNEFQGATTATSWTIAAEQAAGNP
jgi:hypothetical protein